LIKTRRICKTCGIEKSLGEFGYRSNYCKECVKNTRGKEFAAKRKINKQKQELYKVMKARLKEKPDQEFITDML